MTAALRSGLLLLGLSPLWGALCCPLASAAPVADGIALFGGRLYPTLGAELSHESNYLRVTERRLPNGEKPAALATWVTELQPKLTYSLFRGQRAARAYRVEYNANIGTVEAARDNDYVDHRFATSANWESNLSNRFRAEYEFLRWHDRRGSNDPDDVSRRNFSRHPDLWKSNRFEAGWTIGRPGRPNLIDLWTIHYARRYINNDQKLRDNDRLTLNATMSRLALPKTRVLVQLNWQDIDYIRERPGVPTKDSEELRLYLGGLWEMSRKTHFNVRGGYLGKDFEAPQREDVSDFGWEADVRWRPKLDRMVLDLSTKRLPRESTEGFSDSTVISSYEVNWLHHLRQNRLWYEVGGWYTSDDYVGDPRVDNRWEVRSGVFGRLRKRTQVGLEYQHQARESDLPAARYNNDVLQLTLEVRL